MTESYVRQIAEECQRVTDEINSVRVLNKIANDTLNWSKEVRDACKAGADAIREKDRLDHLLKCWQEKLQ